MRPGARIHRSSSWTRRGGLAATGVAVAFLGAPALAGVPARLANDCGGWIALAVALELASAMGFVVFFKLVFAAPMRWRHSIPAGLRALGATTILPAGGLIGPSIGAWSASTARPSLSQLTRSTVTFIILTSAPATIGLAVVGTLLWLGLPTGPHEGALTLLPASLALGVLAMTWLVARSPTQPGQRSRLPRILAKPAGTLRAGLIDAQALVNAGDWKLVGSLAYSAFDLAVLWAAFHAYGHTPPIAVLAMGYLIGSLAGALPIPAGLGAVDGGLIGALVLYGAPVAPAAAAVLLYRGITLALPVALGAIGWMSSPAIRTLGVEHPAGRSLARGRRASDLVTAPAES